MGASLVLVAIIVLTFGVFAAMMWKETVLDFMKANFGLFILLLIFLVLFGGSFYVFHAASGNPMAKDFMVWLQNKASEVLASIMTLIVTGKAANGRASDKTAPDATSTSMGVGTLGIPH